MNGAHHRTFLNAYMVIVLAHWAERLAQAFQIYALGRPIPASRGVLGQFFPWLVTSEWLHFGYALIMLAGLWLLRKAFVGRSRVWWMAAFGIQFWHHLEHLLLFIQGQTGAFLFGRSVPTSVLQPVIPRVELHLFYNTAVFLPMVIAMYYHLRPSPAELDRAVCTCAAHAVPVAATRVSPVQRRVLCGRLPRRAQRRPALRRRHQVHRRHRSSRRNRADRRSARAS